MDWFWELLNYGNWMGLPALASEHGRDVDMFILYVHWLMAALFAGWLAYFVVALWKFRKARHPRANYAGVQSSAPKYVEVAVIIAETILIAALAIPAWAKRVDSEHFPDPAKSTVLRVTAQQFNWNARYPGKDGVFGRQDPKLASGTNPYGIDPSDPAAKDDIQAPQNQIWVPINKPVIIHLTSLDVIHSFALKNQRMCQDAIPGMSIPIHFVPTLEGRYLITCAQLCGNSHAYMRAWFTVANQANYDKWLGEQAAATPAPGASAFE